MHLKITFYNEGIVNRTLRKDVFGLRAEKGEKYVILHGENKWKMCTKIQK